MARKKKDNISYESSIWYIKIWRYRWYLYAILLYSLKYINVQIWIDYILNNDVDDKEKKELENDWKYIKRHIELSKMYKYTINKHEDDE